jgi:hypothetical protein
MKKKEAAGSGSWDRKAGEIQFEAFVPNQAKSLAKMTNQLVISG